MKLIDKDALVAKIEKLQSEIAEEKKLHEDNSMWYNGINHGFNLTKDILNDLEVKDLQEEPVSIDFEQELYKAFGQVKDFTLGMRIAKWFYDMGKNSQEPVSEDLRQVAYYYACKCHPLVTNCGETSPNPEVKEAVIYGAQWQKKQDQSTIELAEDHAMFAGMEKMKEQMMKEMPKWKGNWLGHTKKPCIADEIPGHNGKQLCVAGKCISIDDLWTKLSKED